MSREKYAGTRSSLLPDSIGLRGGRVRVFVFEAQIESDRRIVVMYGVWCTWYTVSSSSRYCLCTVILIGSLDLCLEYFNTTSSGRFPL